MNLFQNVMHLFGKEQVEKRTIFKGPEGLKEHLAPKVKHLLGKHIYERFEHCVRVDVCDCAGCATADEAAVHVSMELVVMSKEEFLTFLSETRKEDRLSDRLDSFLYAIHNPSVN